MGGPRAVRRVCSADVAYVSVSAFSSCQVYIRPFLQVISSQVPRRSRVSLAISAA